MKHKFWQNLKKKLVLITNQDINDFISTFCLLNNKTKIPQGKTPNSFRHFDKHIVRNWEDGVIHPEMQKCER